MNPLAFRGLTISLNQAMAHTERRFPPPWEVHEATESFCIRDANGQALTQGTR